MFMRNETTFLDSDIVAFPGFEPTEKREPKSALNYGMAAGTLIETTQGWSPVETLTQGAEVITYDGDAKTLSRVERSFTCLPRTTGMIHVPGGVIQGVSDLALLPDQLIMLSSSLAETQYGSPDVLLPAACLDVVSGVTTGPSGAVVDLTSFGFDDEEVVFVGGDLRLHCPLAQTGAALTQDTQSEFWTVLDAQEGRDIAQDVFAHLADLAKIAC